jgi:hypothetical protein
VKEFLARGGRRGLVATVTVVVFTVSGITAIAVSVAAQRHAPEPPPSAAGSLGPKSNAIPAVRSTTAPAEDAVGPVLPRSKPVSLDIPAIDVHSSLQYLGLTEQGTLEVPAPGPLYNVAAWYKYSPTPGSLGPAVISGHVDSKAQGPSVFFNLGDMRPGDEVLVTRTDGLVAVFRVDGVRHYPKDDFPTRLVYGSTDHAALRLITCGGPFDFATGHYIDNIVVFASLVGVDTSGLT